MAVPTEAQRKQLGKMGIAMPDGSYYIRNSSDLENAIRAVGRGDSSHDSIRKHCIVRAKALNLENMIPDDWNSDGSLKHSGWIADVETHLEHFGVKGMHWGVRRQRGSDGQLHEGPSSADHARTAAIKAKASQHGIKSLSNEELQHLLTRLDLESRHGKLSVQEVSAGKKALDELLSESGDLGKQLARQFAKQYAVKGIENIIKKAGG